MTCKDCGNNVSKRADKCPHCGAPLKDKTSKLWGCLLTLTCFFVLLILLFNQFTTQSDKQTQQAPSHSIKPQIQSDDEEFKKNLKEIVEKTRQKLDSIQKSESSQKKVREFYMHQRILVDELVYTVHEMKWDKGPLNGQYPRQTFLIIKIEIQNEDKRPRTIPSFLIIDDNGAEYEKYDKSWLIKGTIGDLERLNPNATKHGLIIFDVSEWGTYKLKISGDFFSTNYALIWLI